MEINNEAVEHLKKNLGKDFDDFFAVLNEKPKRAIRINALKAEPKEIAVLLKLEKGTPYCRDAYLSGSSVGGDHPYHRAGLFYMQEPSAMLPIEAARPYLTEIFDREPYPLVLDLCAAPGGKSGQVAALMNGRGALLSNEIVHKRALVLAANLERLGVRNSLVTSDSPDKLANLLEGTFDAVIADVPCSGEGMLRKEADAWSNMNEKTMLACAARQKEIIKSAVKCLKENGILIYSTCTLNTAENEEILSPLLKSGEFETLDCPHLSHVRKSNEFAAYRAFPQDGEGEGHFLCVLRKKTASAKAPKLALPFDSRFKQSAQLLKLLSPICKNPVFNDSYMFRDSVILSPPLPFVKGLSVVKAGVKAATSIKNSALVPEHAFALALKNSESKIALSLNYELENEKKAVHRELLVKYLHGEELASDIPYRGFGLIGVDSYPIGLIKAIDGAIKNHYPKGLRINSI